MLVVSASMLLVLVWVTIDLGTSRSILLFYSWDIIGEGSGALIVSGNEHDLDAFCIQFDFFILKLVMFDQARGILVAGGSPTGGVVSIFARNWSGADSADEEHYCNIVLRDPTSHVGLGLQPLHCFMISRGPQHLKGWRRARAQEMP